MRKGDSYFISAFDIQKPVTSIETFRSALNQHLDQKRLSVAICGTISKKCSTETKQ